jgi:hypothetical protein
MSIIELASPPKKGPSVSIESDEPPDTTPTTTSVFILGYYEKTLAKAIFKAARKGKNKLVSIVLASEFDYKNEGGFVKPPQQQWKYYQGIVGGFLGMLQFEL